MALWRESSCGAASGSCYLSAMIPPCQAASRHMAPTITPTTSHHYFHHVCHHVCHHVPSRGCHFVPPCPISVALGSAGSTLLFWRFFSTYALFHPSCENWEPRFCNLRLKDSISAVVFVSGLCLQVTNPLTFLPLFCSLPTFNHATHCLPFINNRASVSE